MDKILISLWCMSNSSSHLVLSLPFQSSLYLLLLAKIFNKSLLFPSTWIPHSFFVNSHVSKIQIPFLFLPKYKRLQLSHKFCIYKRCNVIILRHHHHPTPQWITQIKDQIKHILENEYARQCNHWGLCYVPNLEQKYFSLVSLGVC